MKIINKKFIRKALVGLVIGLIFSVGIYSGVLAGSYSGTIHGLSSYEGYFTHNTDYYGVAVLPVISNDQAIPNSVNTVTKFVNLLKDANSFGDLQRKTGSAFIVCTILNEWPGSTCKNAGIINANRIVYTYGWDQLTNNLTLLNRAGSIKWTGNVDASVNSYYQSTNHDDALYDSSRDESGIRILNSNGTIAYELLRRCANPMGDTNGIINKWTIQPGIDVLNILNSSNVKTGSTTTANLGDTITWQHSINNIGPNQTDMPVDWDYTNNAALGGGSGGEQSEPIGYTVAAPSRTFNSTHKVGSADLGKTLCRYTRAWPYMWNKDPSTTYDGTNGTTVGPSCVTVLNPPPPIVYTLTPTVSPINPGAIEAGSLLNVTSDVNNSGDASALTTWSLYRNVNGGTWGAPISSKSGVTFSANTDTILTYPDTDTANLSPGDKVCYVLSVDPHSSSDQSEFPSLAVFPAHEQCALIGKKPKTQVLAGDLIVGGNVTTSTTTIGSSTYGSWAEYGIIASSGISGAASGAAFAGPGLSSSATVCGESQLSFTNTPSGGTSCNGNAGTIGYYTNDAAMPDVAASFPGGTPITPHLTGLAPSSLTGTYTYSGDLTLNASTLVRGQTVVIEDPSGTVTIAGDQTYNPGPYTSIDQLPQLVIIANSIVIDSNVTNVDAWLVAYNSSPTGGSIYTCETNPEIIGDCANSLLVNGPVMTNHLYLRRTYGSDTSNPGEPAEIFNLRADAYLWAIAHATTEGSIQTVDTIELPPRL
ncbi:MAG TPA: hypothetical protein VMR16_02625 [Candidatus Saccharimonadales bacterium]|nr:hypothetical protein [Candidatus Saccharimonadales bacterium]